MTITSDQLVNRDVHYCASSLISTLAQGIGSVNTDTRRIADRIELARLTEQAFELAASIPDYESAARENGWDLDRANGRMFRHVDGDPDYAQDWAEACEKSDIEPHDREVYEHWIVSDWLADELEAHGEKVDRDFAGLTVWARTCTGQAIALDSVIVDICAEVNAAA